MVKVVSGYDGEWGFACRIADPVHVMRAQVPPLAGASWLPAGRVPGAGSERNRSMNDAAASVRDRGADVLALPAHGENARGLIELIDTGIPVQPAHVEVQEIDVVAAEETEEAAEVRIAFFVSLGLLALFVVIFVGYLVLDAAHLLPLSLHSDQ
jgi:hypothetical protein